MRRDSMLPQRPTHRSEEAPVATVAVTGGLGHLGTHVCRALALYGYQVVMLDARDGGKRPLDATVRTVDLRDFPALLPALAGVHAVVHTAAFHGLHREEHSSDTFFSNNVWSTFNVLQAAVAQKVRRIVFTSTMGIYGEAADATSGRAIWVTERTPHGWRKADVYAATKVLGEDLCEHYARKFGLTVISLRCTRFSDDDYFADNLRKLSQGVDPRDVAEAHRLAVEAPIRGFRAYNVAAKLPYKRRDLGELFTDAPSVVERHFPGVTQLLSCASVALPSSIGRVYDISRAERELGYRPRHNFAEFLTELESQPRPGGPAADSVVPAQQEART